MDAEQVKHETERKVSIRKYAEKYVKGEVNNSNSIEQRIAEAMDSAALPLIRETEIGEAGNGRIWKRIQKKYLSVMWSWYLNRVFLRQTRYNKELIAVVQILNKKVNEQKEMINILERKLNSIDHD